MASSNESGSGSPDWIPIRVIEVEEISVFGLNRFGTVFLSSACLVAIESAEAGSIISATFESCGVILFWAKAAFVQTPIATRAIQKETLLLIMDFIWIITCEIFVAIGTKKYQAKNSNAFYDD